MLSETERQRWLPWYPANAAQGNDVSMPCADSECSRLSFRVLSEVKSCTDPFTAGLDLYLFIYLTQRSFFCVCVISEISCTPCTINIILFLIVFFGPISDAV